MAERIRDLQVETVSVSALQPYARNARTHSPKQIRQIAASIEEFGWTNPVLIDGKGGIIAGHGRVMAARKLGIDRVPCIDLAHLTPAQRRAYVIADNKLALNAGWDDGLLKLELGELALEGFDLELTGFSGDELSGLGLPGSGQGKLTDPDDVPEAPETPVSARGDLWAMGAHRLLCGDATDAGDVERALDGAKPHLMVTDPPYGVEYDAIWRNEADERRQGFSTGKRSVGVVRNDDRADWSQVWALFPGDVAYVWHADKKGVGVGLMELGFELRAQIIWAKNNIVIGRGHYLWVLKIRNI
ncbi:MAG: ParB N-terminal domain-containing protein [Planctomycetes bacterium]|nr:ParB N-terminal domain-containing protein [Planctomycetota bacterium]